MTPTPDQNKIDKLNKMFELMQNDTVTPAELEKFLKFILDFITQAKDKFDSVSKENLQKIQDMMATMQQMHSDMSSSMSQEMKDCMKECDIMCKEMASEMDKKMSVLENKIPEPTDLSGLENKIKEVEAKILPFPKLPDELTPYQIIEKLESIDNESEKLSIEAIKDLRKELDDLKKKWTSRPIFGGGGFSVGAMSLHIIDDETPSGTKNGVNTTFTISHIPSPTSSLKVYVNGQRQRITENYTFSGVTITFIDPPLSTDIILCDFRI